MELRINDYVRTNDGNIFQITGSDIEFASEIGSDGNLPFNAKIISSEIIDLIEVGDYVNGERVIYKQYKEYPNPLLDHYVVDTTRRSYSENEIKSIVTHEQFSQMEYRIGE